MIAKQLAFDFEVTAEQACIMCHLSSECSGCCRKCIEDGKNGSCNSRQLCTQGSLEQSKRWNAWIYHLKTFDYSKRLIKFLPEKWRKYYGIKLV